MNSAVHFSSATDHWATPQAFFDDVNERHGPFDLDVCATTENAKCARFYTKEQDGLSLPWTGRVWMNPPYGRTIGLWMKKAYESVESGEAHFIACLVPARTDTKWWHDYAERGRIKFIRGRLKFGNAKHGAPFPSVLVFFSKPPPDNYWTT